jgi:hypothetical protein
MDTKNKNTKTNVKRAHELRLLFQELAPKCPVKVASAIAVDLADLSDVASEHKKHVRQFLRLAQSARKERVGTLLAEIDVNLLFHADWHLKSLKKNLPKYVRYLHKSSENDPGETNVENGRTPSKSDKQTSGKSRKSRRRTKTS